MIKVPRDELHAFQASLRRAGLDGAIIASPEALSSVNCRYLSGFTGSSAFLAIGIQQAWLLTDFRYTEQAQTQSPDFTIVRYGRSYMESIADICRTEGWRRVGFEADKLPVAMFEEWRTILPAIDWTPIPSMIERLRLVKSAWEVDRIARAAAIADEALSTVLPGILGCTEAEVALALEIAMRKAGAEHLAFSTIVASGPRGSLPHAHPTNRIIRPGDLVTIDFGAYVDGYNSDETVTVMVGPADSRQREIYDIVYAAQQAGIAAIRPGVAASQVDKAARSLIQAAGYADAFGHSTGHGVGLEVHEAPAVGPNPASDETLKIGMVLTVEPGIYLPGWGGVRLEDTLVVTETGSRRLTGRDKQWQVF